MRNVSDLEIEKDIRRVNRLPGVWARQHTKIIKDSRGNEYSITGFVISHAPSRMSVVRYAYDGQRTERGCWRECLDWLRAQEARMGNAGRV